MSETSTRPTISVDMFAKLARTLTPQELARLPINKLPAHIPPQMLRDTPHANREILNDLLVELEAKRMHEHVEDLHSFGKEIATAFDRAESSRMPDQGRSLRERLRELGVTLQTWMSKRAASGAADGSFLATLNTGVDQVRELASDLRSQLADFHQAEHVLRRKAGSAGAARTRIADAVQRLREKTSPARKSLSQYYNLRLSLSYQEMRSLRHKVETEHAAQAELQAQIDELRRELDTRQSVWRKALARYRSGDDYSQIQGQITRLIAEKRSREVIVPEESLQRWLDSIVDASLDAGSRKLCAQVLPDARGLLYWSLSQYCQQQETSARQIARNPFSQVNAHDAIQYLLLSEQFLLDYFMRRREENPFWFSSAVEERREALDGMMENLLRELKQNVRAFG